MKKIMEFIIGLLIPILSMLLLMGISKLNPYPKDLGIAALFIYTSIFLVLVQTIFAIVMIIKRNRRKWLYVGIITPSIVYLIYIITAYLNWYFTKQ